MSDVELEGVLSEAILDELAADLGIEPTVLRNHPFFRVYRGRILLTYPLKTQELQFTYYNHAEATFAAAATFVPAANTIVMTCRGWPADKIVLMNVPNAQIQASPQAGLHGMYGCVMCDGTDVGYKNTDVGIGRVDLYGVTMG